MRQRESHESSRPREIKLSANSPSPNRRSWPYAVTAIVALAVQQGWDVQQVISLSVILLVFIALITSADRRDG